MIGRSSARPVSFSTIEARVRAWWRLSPNAWAAAARAGVHTTAIAWAMRRARSAPVAPRCHW